MAYNWERKLWKDLKNNPNAKDDLRFLYRTFWDIFRITESERMPKSQILTMDYAYLFEHNFAEDYLIAMLDLPEIEMDSYRYKADISKDAALALTHDFYMTTPPDIFETFLEIFKKRKTHFKFNNSLLSHFYSGHTYVSPTTDDCFIEVQRKGTISDAVIATHEYGHGIDYFINPYEEKPECYNVYSEVSSIFFELIAMDYWEQFNEFKQDIENERKLFYASLIDDAGILRDKFYITTELQDLMNTSYYDNLKFREFYTLLRKQLEFTRQEMKICLKNPANSLMPYTLSSLIALELYHIYQTDPDFAFYLYRKFNHLKGRTAHILDRKINELGINPTQHIDTFVRKLKLNDE